MSWPAFFWPHTVQVRDVVTRGGLGTGHGTPRTIPAEVKDEQQLVRDRDGAEVVSSTNVTVRLDAPVTLGALVTVWAGTDAEREATVLRIGRHVESPPLESFAVLYLE